MLSPQVVGMWCAEPAHLYLDSMDMGMDMGSWQHFQHDADIGLLGCGATLDEAFEQIAIALTAVITDPAGVQPRVEVSIHCAAPDAELLLVDWLNALVYEMATRNMLFGRFRCHIDASRLEASAWGEPIDVARHAPAVEVKGATYTGLRVSREGGMWVASCVVDV